MARELAMDEAGNMSWCSVPAEQRGSKGCPHKSHKESGESSADFVKRAEEQAEKFDESGRLDQEKLHAMMDSSSSDNQLTQEELQKMMGSVPKPSESLSQEKLREMMSGNPVPDETWEKAGGARFRVNDDRIDFVHPDGRYESLTMETGGEMISEYEEEI